MFCRTKIYIILRPRKRADDKLIRADDKLMSSDGKLNQTLIICTGLQLYAKHIQLSVYQPTRSQAGLKRQKKSPKRGLHIKKKRRLFVRGFHLLAELGGGKGKALLEVAVEDGGRAEAAGGSNLGDRLLGVFCEELGGMVKA